jgi:hypothetical protein
MSSETSATIARIITTKPAPTKPVTKLIGTFASTLPFGAQMSAISAAE